MKLIPYRLLLLYVLPMFYSANAQPAFPGAEGFGAMSTGGRGGQVLKVTNLNDNGPGSLREAIEIKGPRIVIFDVSGTIELQSRLKVSNPYITIAGQTAPGDGICLKNYDFVISADHVIIRYLRFRPGDNEGLEIDAVWVSGGHHIIIDHCSTSWAVDETLSVAGDNPDLGNVTIQWCMITESLNCAVHSKGCHGYGSLVRGGWGNGYSFHHNLYAHHRGRSPRPGNYNSFDIDPNGLIFDFRNNVVYNWGGSHAGYNADTNSITLMNFIGNYYIEGPNSTYSNAFYEQCPYSKAYFKDNWMNGSNPRDPWGLVRFDNFTNSEINKYKLQDPILVPPVLTDDTGTAYELVLADAGDSFPTRDQVDTRIINEVINGTGSIIDDEDEVGGWPVLESTISLVDTDNDGMPDDWELVHCLNAYDPSDAGMDRDGDGYTNIEEYINWLPLNQPIPSGTDLNCDNIVNFLDFSDFARYYLHSYRHHWYYDKYDLNHDGVFSIIDMSYIADNWLSEQ
jgi:pectate lyase